MCLNHLKIIFNNLITELPKILNFLRKCNKKHDKVCANESFITSYTQAEHKQKTIRKANITFMEILFFKHLTSLSFLSLFSLSFIIKSIHNITINVWAHNSSQIVLILLALKAIMNQILWGNIICLWLRTSRTMQDYIPASLLVIYITYCLRCFDITIVSTIQLFRHKQTYLEDLKAFELSLWENCQLHNGWWFSRCLELGEWILYVELTWKIWCKDVTKWESYVYTCMIWLYENNDQEKWWMRNWNIS